MAKNKQLTIDALLKMNTDTSSFGEIRTKLEKVFSSAKVDRKFADGMLKQLDTIQKRAEQIFNFQFDPKNAKITKSLSNELNSYQKQFNDFIAYMGSAATQDALLPVKGIEDDLRKLEADYKQTIATIKQGFQQKTGVKFDNFTGMSDAEINKINQTLEKHNTTLAGQQAKLDVINAEITEETVKLAEQKAAYATLETAIKGTTDPTELKNYNKDLVTTSTNIDKITASLKASNLEKQVQEAKVNSTKSQIANRQAELDANTQNINLKKQLLTQINQETAAYEKQVKVKEREKSLLMTQRSQYDGFVSKEMQDAINGMTNLHETSALAAKGIDDQAESAKKAGIQNSYLAQQLALVTSGAYLVSKAFDGLRYAVQTVTDLDKAMTGIAVVTNQTREQVWGNYESFQGLADRLNSTTQDIAEAALLYYQQGLKTSEVMAVVESTTIAATLAGIDFAEASERMTAAIRGFDMEMSDSVDVTDTFSSLAAYTAADFNELSYALTKTASIAHTANMSLENTTAFLAKMIETTREAPENLGTAMKSIIARMAELKAAPGQALEDGTDLNKTQTALRSVGIELLDTKNEMRAFDEVLMELGTKWQYIDRNTQSYIATVIAGNRQQSRFLALMSNFGRTMEMVDIANNSAGESVSMFNTYITGVEASTNRLIQAQQNLANSYLKSDTIISFKDTLAGLLNTLAAMPAALTAFAMTMTVVTVAVTKAKLAQSLFNGSASLSSKIMKLWTKEALTTAYATDASSVAILKNAAAQKLKTLASMKDTAAIIALYIAEGKFAAVQSFLRAGILKTTGAILASTGAILASAAATMLALAPYVAIVAAIGGVIAAINWLVTHTKKEIEATKEQITAANEHAESAKQEMADLKALGERYDELANKINKTTDEQKEFIELQQTIADKFPELVSGFDEFGNAIISNSKDLSAALAKEQEEQLKSYHEQRQIALEGSIDLFKNGEYSADLMRKIKDYQKYNRQQKIAEHGKIGGPIEEGVNLKVLGADIEANKKAEILQTYKVFANDIVSTVSSTIDTGSAEMDTTIKNLLIPMGSSFVKQIEDEYGKDIDTLLDEGSDRIIKDLENVVQEMNSVLATQTVDNGELLGTYVKNTLETIKNSNYGEIKTVVKEATAEIDKSFADAVANSGLSDTDKATFAAKTTAEAQQKFLEKLANQGNEEAQAILDSWKLTVGVIVQPQEDTKDAMEILKKDFEKAGVDNFDSFGDKLGVSTSEVISNALAEAESDPELLKESGQLFDTLFSGLDDSQFKEIENIFADLDTRSFESLANFRQSLIDTGFVSESMADKIVDAVQQIDAVRLSDALGVVSKTQEKVAALGKYQTTINTDGGLAPEEIIELTSLYPELANSVQMSSTEVDKLTISTEKLATIQEQKLVDGIHQSEYAIAKMNKQISIAQDNLLELYNSNEKNNKTFRTYNDLLVDVNAGRIDLNENEQQALDTIRSYEGELNVAQRGLQVLQQQLNNVSSVLVQGVGASLQSTASDWKTLYSAMDEYNENGNLSIDTTLSIIEKFDNWYEILEITENGIRINEQACKDLMIAQIDLEIATLNARLEHLNFIENMNTTQKVWDILKNKVGSLIASFLGLASAEQLAADAADGILTKEQIAEQKRQIEAAIALAEQEKDDIQAGNDTDTKSDDKDKSNKGKSDSKVTIDKYHALNTAIENVNNALTKNDALLELNKDNIIRTNELLKNKVDLMAKEQDLLHQLNEARRQEIQTNIKQLTEWGFIVDYNASSNTFLVKNMNKLDGASGDLAESQKKLIDETIKLNEANADGSSKWYDLQKNIKSTTKDFKTLFNQYKEGQIKQIGWMIDDINHQQANDKDLQRWNEKLSYWQEYKDNLNGVDNELEEINQKIKDQKQLIADLQNERNKAVYNQDTGWEWTYDVNAVQDAKNELGDLEKQHEELLIDQKIEHFQSLIERREKIYEASLNNLQLIQDNLQYEVDSSNREIVMSYDDLTAAMDIWGVATTENLETVKTAFNTTVDAISEAVEKLQDKLDTNIPVPTQSSGGGGTTTHARTATLPDGTKTTVNINSSGKTTTPNLPTGTIVHTDGGNYTIDKGTGGNYTSHPSTQSEIDAAKKKKKYDKGGLATGKGLLSKQINDTETVLGPDISAMILDPEKSREFKNFIEGITTLFGGGVNLGQFETNNLDALGDISTLVKGIQSGSTSSSTSVTNQFDKLVLPNVTDGRSFLEELNLIKNVVITSDRL